MTATSVTTEQDVRSVLARLDAWATTHQFVRDKDFSWYVKRLPQQDTLAQVELRHLWRPSVFDRWHMTWAGVQRAAPDIALEIIGDANGKQTVVQLKAHDPAMVTTRRPRPCNRNSIAWPRRSKTRRRCRAPGRLN